MEISEKDSLRFWSKVKISETKFWNNIPCWEWIAGIDSDGYGGFGINGKSYKAHRISWILKCGNIPNDKPLMLHHCDNRKCVNPDHLFIGTVLDNVKDRDNKGRTAKGDKSGVRLHPENFQGENNGRAKLTKTDILEIRKLFSTQNYTTKKLSEMFNVTQGHIRDIVN